MPELSTITVRLGFVSADDERPDPATTGTVARQSVDYLRQQGYTIEPAYSETKGGDIFTIAAQLGQNIVDNKELLVALIGVATPILTFLLDRHEKRLETDEKQSTPSNQQQQQSIQVYLTIDQATTRVDPADLDDNERLLRKLLEIQPDLTNTLTSETTPEIEVHVPVKLSRRRR